MNIIIIVIAVIATVLLIILINIKNNRDRKKELPPDSINDTTLQSRMDSNRRRKQV